MSQPPGQRRSNCRPARPLPILPPRPGPAWSTRVHVTTPAATLAAPSPAEAAARALFRRVELRLLTLAVRTAWTPSSHLTANCGTSPLYGFRVGNHKHV